MRIIGQICFSIFILAAMGNAKAQTSSTLPLYRLSISPENVDRLNTAPCGSLFVPAGFRFDNREWNVEARYRGQSSCEAAKRSFFIRFPDDAPFAPHHVVEDLLDAARTIERLLPKAS